MALHGVDVSHHQNDAGMEVQRVARAVDFVLVKATQGSSFVDPQFRQNLDGVREVGRLIGTYHFAGETKSVPGDPVAEANHYCDSVDRRPGEVLVLDYEPVKPPADPDGWCAAFLAQAHQRMGVVPLIYMGEVNTRERSWSRTRALKPGLWIARYGKNNGLRPAIDLNVGSWGRFDMWQYTSEGRVDGCTGVVVMTVVHKSEREGESESVTGDPRSNVRSSFPLTFIFQPTGTFTTVLRTRPG